MHSGVTGTKVALGNAWKFCLDSVVVGVPDLANMLGIS